MGILGTLENIGVADLPWTEVNANRFHEAASRIRHVDLDLRQCDAELQLVVRGERGANICRSRIFKVALLVGTNLLGQKDLVGGGVALF